MVYAREAGTTPMVIIEPVPVDGLLFFCRPRMLFKSEEDLGFHSERPVNTAPAIDFSLGYILT
jgi:hypothetical protein